MTIIETLPTAFTGPNVGSLPKYQLDPMLNAGTMFLIEPAATWDTGVPANNTAVNNMAASKLVARGFDPALTWVMDADANNGTNGKIERTAKGGIHAIASKTAPMALDHGAAVLFPQWFAQFIIDNPTRRFGWSAWFRPTRAFGQPSGNYVISTMQTNSLSAGINSSPFLGFPTAQPLAAARTSKEAVPVTPDANMLVENKRHAMSFGRRSSINKSMTDVLPSYIMYRMTLEDLTASGRTYAQFDAQDSALYATAFGAGGRYAGDTFTDPATIA